MTTVERTASTETRRRKGTVDPADLAGGADETDEDVS